MHVSRVRRRFCPVTVESYVDFFQVCGGVVGFCVVHGPPVVGVVVFVASACDAVPFLRGFILVVLRRSVQHVAVIPTLG